MKNHVNNSFNRKQQATLDWNKGVPTSDQCNQDIDFNLSGTYKVATVFFQQQN